MKLSLIDQLSVPLRYVSPQMARKLMLCGLKAASYKEAKALNFNNLQQDIWGRRFYSPIGLAAGFDKNAEAIGGHFHLGFGFAEFGTVTGAEEKSKTKPLLKIDKNQKTIIYNHDLCNDGLRTLCMRLGSFRLMYDNHWGQVGVNIGVSKNSTDWAEDFRQGVNNLGGMADYIVLNFCHEAAPALSDYDKLKHILADVMEEREKITDRLPAILLKVPLNFETRHISDFCRAVIDHEVNGLIIGEAPSHVAEGKTVCHAGALIKTQASDALEIFYREAGNKVILISAGGILDAQSAYERIKKGASLLQIYTGLTINGPGFVNKLNKELDKLLTQDGFQSIGDAVGSAY